VPLYYRSKQPHSQALIRSGLVKDNGKATWTPLKHCLPTIDQVSQWFENGKRYNLALITTPSFIVLDFDNPQEYATWYCWQSEHNPVVLDTYIVTSGRGLHLYYRLDNPLTEPIKGQNPYEVKSHGRLINIPPSVHPNGIPYCAINSPSKILTVDDISEVLTFSPAKIKRPIVKRSNDPWEIKPDNGTADRIDLLDLFPEARPTDDEGKYWIADCPIHGHRNNFMLNVADNVCYCYAGCGVFLASKLVELINKGD
jgi:hypothetical protein